MNLVEETLEQMSDVNKPQRKFMVAFFVALFICVGRATMTNLSRYGAGSRRRIARWKKRPFDFWQLNVTALRDQNITNHRTAAAFDCTFLPKSGKQTYGLAKFYNACASRAERGLEAGVLGLLDLDENTAYALKATQTPPESPEGETRTDFYVRIVQENAPQLLELTSHLVVDGGLAKKKFVDGVCETGLQIVGKLRHDSNLRYLYKGPKREGRGRPKSYDGKVDYEDLSRLGRLCLPEDGLLLWNGVVNHPEFKRDIKVVVVQDDSKKGAKRGHVVLYSTDLALGALEIYELYKARFQLEFVFRDGKQFTGFADGQMRDQAGLDFQLNASLSAVNLLRLEDREAQNKPDNRVISLRSWKRRKYNEGLMNQIFSDLENELTEEKRQELHDKYRNFGAVAA
jgi:hypothetical protein